MTPIATPLLAAAVIVHDASLQRVVLIQRGPGSPFGRGLWDLPAGKSLPDEPVTETAVRELHEETGLEIEASALTLVHVVHSSWGVVAPDGYVTMVFAAREWSGSLTNREPIKHAKVCWKDISQIPDSFVSTTARALRSYLTGGSILTLDGWA